MARFSIGLLVLCGFCVACSDEGARPTPESPQTLRVCSDPNNLPFSNEREEGFENAIASLLAEEDGVPLQYTWWAQRRGFLRSTLNSGVCDVVMGLPAEAETARTTIPYYRSSYVFLSPASRTLAISSFDDPALERLRVGVQLVGDDGANSPPAHALSRRGITRNVVGYSVYGDYSQEAPPSTIVAAVAKGEVDVAVVWGPLAGFFAHRQAQPLTLVPVQPEQDGPFPQTFAISMAVRRDDAVRHARLERFIRERREAIEGILDRYHVPRLPIGD